MTGVWTWVVSSSTKEWFYLHSLVHMKDLWGLQGDERSQYFTKTWEKSEAIRRNTLGFSFICINLIILWTQYIYTCKDIFSSSSVFAWSVCLIAQGGIPQMLQYQDLTLQGSVVNLCWQHINVPLYVKLNFKNRIIGVWFENTFIWFELIHRITPPLIQSNVAIDSVLFPLTLLHFLLLSVGIVSRNKSASLRNSLFSVICLGCHTEGKKTGIGCAKSSREAQQYIRTLPESPGWKAEKEASFFFRGHSDNEEDNGWRGGEKNWKVQR